MEKDKLITTILSIIIFIVPAVIIPEIWGQYNLIKIIVLLICGLILLITSLLNINKLKFDKQDIFILIFGLLAIFSTIFSVNPITSLIGAKNRYEGLFTIITYILIYYNAKYYFKNYKKFIHIATIIYILIYAFSIVQYYVANNIQLVPIFGKGANGTFGNTNFMGSFISITLPAFILGYIFKNRKLYLFGSILGFCSMMMCLARSSWVAFLVYMAIITIYLIKTKKKKYFKRFSIIIITFTMCFAIVNQIDKNISNKASKTILSQINVAKNEIETISRTGITEKMGSSRIRIWKITAKVIYQVPILGCGVDTLKEGIEQFEPVEFAKFLKSTGTYIDKAHNEYLQIAATIGIPALLIYIIFISITEISSIRKMFKHKIIAIEAIIIMSYLVQAIFNISTIGVAVIFWFILGITSRNINRKKVTIQK